VLSIYLPPFPPNPQARLNMALRSQNVWSCFLMNYASHHDTSLFISGKCSAQRLKASLWPVWQFHGVDLHFINVLFSNFSSNTSTSCREILPAMNFRGILNIAVGLIFRRSRECDPRFPSYGKSEQDYDAISQPIHSSPRSTVFLSVLRGYIDFLLKL
jgi:hypothetical protein